MAAGSKSHYEGPLDCFVKTLRKEGVHGLYRGMALPLAATVVETSTLFFANGYLKRMLSERGHINPGDELPMDMVLLAGAGTGLVVSFVLTPIELVKCRLQVDESHSQPSGGSSPRYRGPIDCLMKSVEREGLGVVYRGHLATMLREIPGTACWFGAYEAFARWMTPVGHTRQDLPSSVIIAAGALGGMSYWGVMYPCDTIKSAMQIAETTQLPASTSASATAPSARPVSVLAGALGSQQQPSLAALASAAQKLSSYSTVAHVTHASSSSPSTLARNSLQSVRSMSSATHTPAPTFLSTFSAIYRTGGIRGLYAGFLPTILRAAPSNAAIFVGYEWSNTWLKQYI
jgi:hypothetical protein